MAVKTPDPKQGDVAQLTVTAGETSNLTLVKYQINGQQGTIDTVPATVNFNTCKKNGQYYTTLTYSAEATYNDGTKKTCGPSTVDLTVGSTAREDGDRNYAIYVAEDDDEDRVDLRVEMANAFMDEFDSCSQSQYYWARPWLYPTNAISYANSADMVISFGHGSHHYYQAGKSGADGVFISDTEYGNLAPCNNTGDLEYLVFASCQTLSMADSGGEDFWYYWFHENSTKLGNRPFTGLHMALGFRTNHRIVSWWLDNDSADFFEAFASNLDSGMTVINAWQEAAGDELSFADGKNRTAVIYLKKYEGDTISSNKDDHIYGNGEYWQQYIDYYE